MDMFIGISVFLYITLKKCIHPTFVLISRLKARTTGVNKICDGVVFRRTALLQSRWGAICHPVWCHETSRYRETSHPEYIHEFLHATVSIVDWLSGSVPLKFIHIMKTNDHACMCITISTISRLLVTYSDLHHSLGPHQYFFHTGVSLTSWQ